MNDAGRRAVDALPDHVRIAGFDFKLERWTHHQAAGSARYGEFSSVEQVIRIQQDMPSPFKAVDTLLHEISHGICWVYGIKEGDNEERTVSILGTAWMTLHRDNPWLAKWLSKVLA
jgi:hypothetical protein